MSAVRFAVNSYIIIIDFVILNYFNSTYNSCKQIFLTFNLFKKKYAEPDKKLACLKIL